MAATPKVHYEDNLTRPMVFVTICWALIGMGVGLWAAAEMVWPALNLNQPWLSFRRLRTVHTNGVVFGFGGSALMMAAFYSVQRTCHTRLFMPNLAWFVFAGWQLTLIIGAVALFLGIN